ncbi:MAG TPA: sugar-binding protein, partial [Mobilitalea sp.]|nr:sugar-binding protein [Mobilitalea sp.]
MGRKRTVLKQLFACLIAVTMLVPANIFSQSKLNTANAASSAAPVLNVASYRFITVGGSYDFNIRNAISGSSYVWKSSNTQIATVSKSGVVKAKTAGTATITCAIKAKGKSYKLSALVYVKNPVKSPAKEIKIMNKLNDLTIGDEYDLDTLFTPGKASDFVNWTSSDTNIATVNEKGIVQGIKAGKVTITATTLAGKVKDSVSIDVAPRIPDKVTATYGTPVIDGDIDAAWSNASVIVPKVYGAKTDVTAQHRIMWDDNALYVLSVVKDKTLDKSNSTTYQQDSLELFLDEKYDQGTAYKSDDMHYRVNFDNMRSVDSGDKARFYSKTKLTDDGYIVEACIVWDKATKPANNMEFGFDLQINEAKNGSRQTTINIFDTTGNAYQNPSLFGKMVLTGKGQDAVTGTNPYILLSYIDSVNAMSLDVYVNKDTVTEPLSNAEKVAASSTATQEEIDNAYLSLKKAVDGLNDGSGFAKPSSLAFNADLPDPFTFLNSSKVTTLADWQLRKDEIARMYEYYMYGVMPDTSGESITTEYVTTFTMAGWFGPITMNVQPNQKFVKINITKDNKKIDFVAAITFPSTKDKDGTVKIVPPTHADGYPVVIVIGTLSDPQKSYLNDHGYAVIEFSNNEIAADNTSRTGDFYTLYPYGKSWDKQTGVLMAWAWGVSKIVDVIQKDAAGANDLHISPVNTIVNGVSRNGKAAAVAGAFDPRIKVTV